MATRREGRNIYYRLADDRVRELTQGKQVRKVIVVPGKLVNIVVG